MLAHRLENLRSDIRRPVTEIIGMIFADFCSG